MFSKHINCLSDELMIAMLNAYGFSLPTLKLIHDYLSNRRQRTKIYHAYSSWEKFVFRVSKGSVFGPILFNISLSDLFLIIDETEFASYADDNILYDAGNTIEDVI